MSILKLKDVLHLVEESQVVAVYISLSQPELFTFVTLVDHMIKSLV